MSAHTIDLYKIDIYSDVEDLQLRESFTARFDNATKKVVSTYPEDRTKKTLTKVRMKQRIFSEFDSLCKKSIDRNYLNGAINAANILFVMYQEVPHVRTLRTGISMTTSEVVSGFIVGQVLGNEEEKILYLDVICAKNGKLLMTTLIDFCKKHGMTYIKLHSLTSVLGYYPSFGFAHRKNCDASKPAAITIPKSLVDHIRKSNIFADASTAYTDPAIATFLMDLHAKGFTARKLEECQGPLSPADFQRHDCASDGFEMRLCLKDVPEIPDVRDEPAPSASSRLLRPMNLKKKAKKTKKTQKKTRKGKGKGKGKGKFATYKAKQRPAATRRAVSKVSLKQAMMNEDEDMGTDPYLQKVGSKLLKQKKFQQSFKNFRRSRKLTPAQRDAFKSAFKSVGMNINSDSD